jgi:CheY-like chemotaxis protein
MDTLHLASAPEPQILFLDLNMPIKSGKECLDEIRSDDKLLHLPVAIYSTSASRRDIDETYDKGADVYITKPCDYKELKKIILKVLGIDWCANKLHLSKDDFILTL